MPSTFPAKALISLAISASLTPVYAQSVQPSDASDPQVQMQALKREIMEQGKKLDVLQRELSMQQSRYNTLRRAISADELQDQRGRGPADAGSPVAAVAQAPAPTGAASGDSAPVGVAPSKQAREAKVATIFEQPGVLTPKGHYTLEPSFQYGYSSNNRVALVGYTIIPALLIGLIDVREVKRNTLTGALAARFGITNRFEIEAKVPYVYRSDATVSREVFTGSASNNVFNTTGKAVGDVELGARYQLNDGGADSPYYIGTLRFKSRTGKDPFSVVTDCQTRCIGNTTGTGLPTDLPTGSGFYSLQPGLTWLFPTDPAVFFGSFSYTHNFARSNVSRTVLNGEREFLGTITAGDIIGTNFGLGLALNDKSSVSVGFDFNSVGRTKQNGVTVPGSVRTMLATMLFGYSYRLSDRTTMSVAVGAGLTRDTPDVTLNVKLPISF
ncbi:MAG: hypothetical protein NVSMB6_19260 [Burkholderiaceae bacterium]